MRFDAIIIGAGQAAPPLARELVKRGMKVALIEENHLGGSCVNYGCTPSKTIIGSAQAIYTARRGKEYGFEAGDVSVDFARVMERQRAMVQGSRGYLDKNLSQTDGLTLIRDHAEFEAPKRIRVGDDIHEADRIYIDVGARAVVPDIPGLRDIPYLDHVTLLDLNELPRHLIIVGGGYIGVEFAQAFRRLGSEITLIESGTHILSREDEDVADAVECILEQEGVKILRHARAARCEGRGGDIAVEVTGHGEVVGSHVLLALGVKPNTDRLGIERAGIELTDKGHIKVDDRLQTSVEGVYALGDVNGRGAFTHTSYNDYQIIAANLDGGTRKVTDRITTYAVYIDPPLGRVGMNERAVRESGRKALIATLPMTAVSRAREFAQTDGFMKILVDAEDERILGAAILGLSGDEVIQTIAVAMYSRAPYTLLRDTMFIHPTVTEYLQTLLHKLEPLE